MGRASKFTDEQKLEIAVERLTAASAHCLVRYLYDCPKNEFKIADERGTIGWVE
jgi:hypothetical protein